MPDRTDPTQPPPGPLSACCELSVRPSLINERTQEHGHADLSDWYSRLPFLVVIRALIFDFDGLILDTEEPIYRSWLEVYEAHGQELPFDLWIKTVGSTNKAFHPQHHLEERLGGPLSEEVLE